MKVTYSVNEYNAAIQYVLNNNPASKELNWTETEIRNRLDQSIVKFITDDELSSNGTMGFTVMLDDISDDTKYLTITVAPYFINDTDACLYATIEYA